jgi:prepilin peptidase CpaA
MGSVYALGGAITGFAAFLIFYLMGGMGGGDIKLMTGFGALLGASRLLEAALWTAGVGGIFAITVLAWRGGMRWLRPQQAVASGADADSIPYAPAIAMGVWLSLVPKG